LRPEVHPSFIGSGESRSAMLSQAMDYGAKTIQIQGDFDDCMRQVAGGLQRNWGCICTTR
jgi:threonine synthase